MNVRSLLSRKTGASLPGFHRSGVRSPMNADTVSAGELASHLKNGILERWYPLVLDRELGGYFTNVRNDWSLAPEQEKMIVSQARHVWTTSKAAAFVEDADRFMQYARHGYHFLRERMWDQRYGGFYQIRGRDGGGTDVRGWRDEKRAYGNAFGIFALAALYELTHDPDVLETAQRAYQWLEEHAYDPVHGGYHQFLTREGVPFDRSSDYTCIASDRDEIGFKDQNSSIHVLEAYTELYRSWRNPGLREQLSSLLTLIRDTMVNPRGYLHLFFTPDWKPVSFRDATPAERDAHYGLDHVSFGHDYETAFLMLEASFVLGLRGDVRTLMVAKKMLDHAIENGWDRERGGFVDGGYYASSGGPCTVVRPTKNWWAQAEALNALLLFGTIFPDEPTYREHFLRQWTYVNRYLIDHEKGDWFEGGIDREPDFRAGPKSHMWKCTYHTGRALMNCITLLGGEAGRGVGPGAAARRREMDSFVRWWKETARLKPVMVDG
jgi:cellobiose epimerase